MEAEKSHNLQLASWRFKVGDIVPVSVPRSKNQERCLYKFQSKSAGRRRWISQLNDRQRE